MDNDNTKRVKENPNLIAADFLQKVWCEGK
jgi:hypothetical protein